MLSGGRFACSQRLLGNCNHPVDQWRPTALEELLVTAVMEASGAQKGRYLPPGGAQDTLLRMLGEKNSISIVI